jgi:hypothetical protein
MEPLSLKVWMQQIFSMVDLCRGVRLLLKVTHLIVVKNMKAVMRRTWTNSWLGPSSSY